MTKQTFVPFKDRPGFAKPVVYVPPAETFTLTVKPAAGVDFKLAQHLVTHLTEGSRTQVAAKPDGTLTVSGAARESIPVWGALIERPDFVDSVNGVPASLRRPVNQKVKTAQAHAL